MNNSDEKKPGALFDQGGENGAEKKDGGREKKTRAVHDWRKKKAVDNGPLYEKNEVRFPLPPVGSHVVVWVRKTFKRGYGEDGNVRSTWVPDDSSRDAWNRPLVYKVVDYKLGIDEPLSKGNAVRLEATMRSGFVYSRTLPTIHCTNGYYRLFDKDTSAQYLAAVLVNPKAIPVAELNPRARREKESKDKKGGNKTDGAK